MSNATYQFGPSVSKTVKKLIILQSVTAGIILIQHFMIRHGSLSPQFDLVRYFAITPELSVRHFYWQLVSYAFIHTEIIALLFNLLTLWMFGSELERRWGEALFLRFYILCVFGAGLSLFLMQTWLHLSGGVSMGSAGANMGLLLAYAIYWPDRQVWFFFLFPVRMKYVALITGLISLYYAQASSMQNLAAFGHLGGLVTGAVVLLMLTSDNPWLKTPATRISTWLNNRKKSGSSKPGKIIQMSAVDMEKKVDELLEKISRHGMKSLTRHEVDFLRQASLHFDQKTRPPH